MSLKSKEILILDDDPEMRFILRSILESTGVNVIECSNVAEALVAGSLAAPHLAIIDLHLPDEDGFTFLTKRLSDPILSRTPVLILSAANDTESICRSVSLGAEDYIIKPFNSVRLLQKIRRLLHDRDFIKYSFPAASLPVVKAATPCVITGLDESGCTVESTARVAANTDITIEAPLLRRFKITAPLLSSLHPSLWKNDGKYETYFSFSGLSAESLKAIKKMVKL